MGGLSHHIYRITGLSHTLSADLSTHPEKISQTTFSQTAGQDLGERAVLTEKLSNNKFSGSWNGGPTAQYPTGWSLYSAVEGEDNMSQEVADLPTGYTTGAYIAVNTQGGIATTYSATLGQYFIESILAKKTAVGGYVGNFGMSTSAASWTRYRIAGRHTTGSKTYTVQSSASGTNRFTAASAKLSSGHTCILYSTEPATYVAKTYWFLLETYTKAWVDNIAAGAGGKTISAMQIYQQGRTLAGVWGRVIS